MENKQREITGTALKFIAVITMLIDHIGMGVYERWMSAQLMVDLDFSYWDHFKFYLVLRGIGRIAFPIYCFMLVEGFFHTKNIKKYALRLFLAAVISEVPYNMLSHGKLFFIYNNNVIWELLLGLIAMCIMEYINNNGVPFIPDKYIIRRVAMVVVMLAAMYLSDLAGLDYGKAGIGCISVIYFFYGNSKKNRMLGMALGIVVLSLLSNMLEFAALVVLIPMAFYKGARGRDSKALRYFFYLFYPVHFVVLSIIAKLLLGGASGMSFF
ncbi:MAG: conjugal transfer protein TraX [Pseudobutyrivibrio sp.]|nr:conjugal transfer protein TraX [Pseudobutyrivibrio sp.]